ncbi:MAG TPA: hypothetical protein VFI23_02000 [Rhizomicrobium sp.]|nr:hypothetical protein [Rhizomicrobium sp.]
MRKTGPTPCARRWVTILTLLAFFLQGLAVQTHIHQPNISPAVKVQTGATHKTPIKLDPVDHCRLCQELVHAGNFVTPSASIALASLSLVSVIFAALVLPQGRSATAFTWRSRGPPRR